MMPNLYELPPGMNCKYLLDELRSICWGASDILRAYARGEQPPFGFERVLRVDNQSDGPVSAADLAVNSWLLKGFEEKFPSADWEIISEETSKIENISTRSSDQEWLWILDPLDGTKDFLQGTGEYAVHLALVRRDRPVLGVVLIPELEELWFGLIGMGSWYEDRSGCKREVRFSPRRQLSDLLLVSSKNHRDSRLDELLKAISIGGTKMIGSVGCKVATILRGETDFYLSLSGKTAPKDWDMAAPEAVLIAAGGRFTHADGLALRYNKNHFLQEGCLIASHGFSHNELCEKVLSEMCRLDPDFLV